MLYSAQFNPPWRIKGGFFVNIKNINSTRLDRHFWVSLLLDILFYSWAWIISPFMALWHLAFILPYSGFILYGMLIAERYQSIFIIATCVLLSRALPHEVFIVLAALWFYRSLLYIKIFRSNETLFRENCYSHSETSEPYVNLASWLMERGRFNAALAYLLMAIKLGEASSHIYADTSLCYQKCGQFTKALYYLELTLKGCPLDKIELVKRQKRHLEDKIRQVEYHKKTLKRRGII